MKTLDELTNERYLILDGAMGTEIQSIEVPDSAWPGAIGCNELLNSTAPERISAIHHAFLEAGADILKSNTFGCLPWVLDEFELGHRTRELTRAGVAVAKAACEAHTTPDKPRFVAASLGPGTKLPSLGHIDFESMAAGYEEAALGAIEAQADLLLLETCQDPLQIKAALFGLEAAFTQSGQRLPVMVSATIETGGAMLIGTSAATLAAILAPYDLFSLGLNCGMGPDEVAGHIKSLSRHYDGVISLHTNAGLPCNEGGCTVYPMGPEEFATLQAKLASLPGVRILGGCCGTRPAHIAALSTALAGKQPKPATGKRPDALASLFSFHPLKSDALFLIGERANATGSKAFRELLIAEDYEATLSVASEQVRAGAHGLDVSVGFAGRDELVDMQAVVGLFAQKTPLPLMVDSTTPAAIEVGLRQIGGRAIVNSANLEEGEERFLTIARVAKTYGAALVCLAIDEKGMAKTVEQKLAVADRMLELALLAGLKKRDLVFDLLTFTIASGDSDYATAAVDTIEAIRALEAKHPEVGTVLGVSNVSFGLKGVSREYLNAVFLHHAHQAGLSMGIVNVKQLIAMEAIEADTLQVCEDLIFNRSPEALSRFMAFFAARAGEKPTQKRAINDDLPLPERLSLLLIEGEKPAMLKLLPEAKEQIAPERIVNEILIGAMKEVGERFGDGRMQLPFVLQSAEVMKAAVDYLAPYLPKKEGGQKLKLILGTVKGDVHDVGKNLVDIILSNNGFEVVNIGIKADLERFLEALEQHKADAIGMSGLLVKSTQMMQQNLQAMQERGIKVPVLLGGAALNQRFVDEYCQSVYDGPVVFCRDAFDGVRALSDHAAGTLQRSGSAQPPATAAASAKAPEPPKKAALTPTEMPRSLTPPTPPFWGRRELNLDPVLVFEWVDEKLLFKTRWGYGKKGEKSYDQMLESEIRPHYERLKKQLLEEGLFEPVAIYGYWPVRRDRQMLLILDESGEQVLDRMDFPRQSKAPYRALSDYFSPEQDVAGFLLASAGKKLDAYGRSLFEAHRYHEYHLLSGLAGELAEAIAEIVHKQMRIELDIVEGEKVDLKAVQTRGYRGKRYAPGYPACPDLALNRGIFDRLKPESRGVVLTESFQIDPEASTCAVVVHHPEASYYSL
jgi:5-methyltetrahydrofolate--homocysteine methyltransferase